MRPLVKLHCGMCAYCMIDCAQIEHDVHPKGMFRNVHETMLQIKESSRSFRSKFHYTYSSYASIAFSTAVSLAWRCYATFAKLGRQIFLVADKSVGHIVLIWLADAFFFFACTCLICIPSIILPCCSGTMAPIGKMETTKH